MAMTTPAIEGVRIDAEELKERMQSGEAFTVLDLRGKVPWEQSAERIQGDIRVDPYHFQIDPAWPKARPIVAYCT